MLLQDVFINRKKELSVIPQGLSQGQSYVIIAPRRYGKTTLMKKIAAQVSNKNTIVVYIDIMRYANSINSLAEAIVETCLNKVGFLGKVKTWFKNIDLKLDIKVKLHELEIDAIFDHLNNNDDYNALAKAVELPEKLAQKYKKRVLMIYDEFGELQHLDNHAIKVMRSVIQHHKLTSYLFAGSQESLMNKIFINNKGAFYRFGTLYPLAPLEIKDVVEFFKAHLPNIDNEAIDYVVNNFDGHPYYTTNIFFRISQLTPKLKNKQFGIINLKKVITDLIFSESHYLSDQVKNLTSKRHNLDVAIGVCNGNPYNVVDNNVSKQTVYACLKTLTQDGVIVKEQGSNKYKLTDPLLAIYLLDESLSII